MGLEQEPFDAFTGQKEQPPVGMLNELGSRGLVLLQIEHDVGEGCHRHIGRCDPLVNRPLEDTEIPQGRQSPWVTRQVVFSVHSPLVLPSLTHRATSLLDLIGSMSLIPLALQRARAFGHDIVEQPVGPGGVEVEDAVEGWRREAASWTSTTRARLTSSFGEIALPEDGQDVFDPRSGGFAEDVLPPERCEVAWTVADVPMQSSVLVSGRSAPALMIREV